MAVQIRSPLRSGSGRSKARTGDDSMAVRSLQRTTRFTKNGWDAVVEASEKAGSTPGSFVRKAAAPAAADDLYLYGGGLTPELPELIKRTFRGAHMLTYLNSTDPKEKRTSAGLPKMRVSPGTKHSEPKARAKCHNACRPA